MEGAVVVVAVQAVLVPAERVVRSASVGLAAVGALVVAEVQAETKAAAAAVAVTPEKLTWHPSQKLWEAEEAVQVVAVRA